ncbi:MAG: hypothetical protein FWD59_02560 [Micrococcales bacterium]|nr:hypothetical protein [Micrococcales bacterium]
MTHQSYFYSRIVCLSGERPSEQALNQTRESHERLVHILNTGSTSTPKTRYSVLDRPRSFFEGVSDDQDLSGHLAPTASARARCLAVLDFRHVAQAYLRDSFLHGLASYVKDLASADPQGTTVLVFHGLFHDSSLFWEPLKHLPPAGGRVLVLTVTGFSRGFGLTPSDHALDHADLKTLFALDRTLLQRDFSELIVRRMGHYRFAEDYCSQFFWDASEAVDETSKLLAIHLNETLKRRERTNQSYILIPERVTPWFDEVAHRVASETASTLRVILPSKQPWRGKNRQDSAVFPLLDVVTRGKHLEQLLAWAKHFPEENIHPFAVFASKSSLRLFPNLRCLRDVPDTRVLTHACPQCQLHLTATDYSDSHGEPLQIRSFDMWTMLKDVSWVAQTYGPSHVPFGRRFLNMQELIEKNTRYLAYKLEGMLRRFVDDGPLALIAPDEPAMRVLLLGHPTVRRGKYLPVFIHRSIIDRVATGEMTPTAAVDQSDEWRRQLHVLGTDGTKAAVVDEFVDTCSTAQGLIRICSEFGVDTVGCFPIINRSHRREVMSRPIHPLYFMAFPREAE